MLRHLGLDRHAASTALLLTLALLMTIRPAFALTKSLAGVIDWHKPLIGVPREAPRFFDLSKSQGEHILTVSERNVVASLEPSDGSIRWRHQLSAEDRIDYLQVDGDDVLVYSETAVRSFSAQSGFLMWEYFGDEADGPPRHGAFLSDQVVVLTRSGNVQSLERSSGRKVWEKVDIGASSHLQAVPGNSELHLIGGSTYENVSILRLDTNGRQIGSPFTFNSPPSSDLLCGSASCLIFDSARNELRVVPLDVSRKSLPKPSKVPYTTVRHVDLDAKGYFLGERKDGAVDIIKVTGDSFKVVWTFDRSDASASGPSHWSGYSDSQGNAWVIRTFWSFALQLMQVESHNLEHRDGYVNTGHTFPFDDKQNGVMADASGDKFEEEEVAGKILRTQIAYQMSTHEPIVDRFRALVLTSTGALQLWQQEQLIWSREEGLAEIAAITTLELPEKKVEDASKVLEHEGLVERALRHGVESINLPAYLLRFVQRFTSGSYKQALSTRPLSVDHLYRDQFGFQRLAIAVTSLGKVYAIDTANGNIVWQKLLTQSTSLVERPGVQGIWLVREADEGLHPVVAIVWHEASSTSPSARSTQAAHIDAFTGDFIASGCKSKGPQASLLCDGPAKTVFPLPAQHCKSKIRALAVVDDRDEAHLFPFCKKIEGDVQRAVADITFAMSDTSGAGLSGYALASRAKDGRFAAQRMWDLPLHGDRKALPRAATQSPIASYGRVTGDRSTLYKYLNPHLIAVPIQTDKLSTVTLIDSRNGDVVFSSAALNTAHDSAVNIALVENWLVYSYVQSPVDGESTGGQRLVSVELFETNSTSPQVISRTFILPALVTSLTTTASRYGISLKDIIYTNDKGQVAYIPRRMLDPRRPDVPTKADKEEMLIPYDPLLIADPKRTLSHANDLIGTKHIVASPALLESTSILFAYGLDLFGSRITPSGTFDILSDAFNKTQLLLTIAVLVVGLVFAKPAVDRRLMRSKWY